MPEWLALEMTLQDAADAALPFAVPEVPSVLLEGPLVAQEPRCDCCGSTRHEPPEPSREPVRWAVPGVWGDEPVGVVPSVGELVATVQQATALLASTEPSVLSPDRALGEAAALAGVQHQLRVLQLSRTADVKDRELYAHLGYRSLAAWQRDTAPDAAGADRTLSRRLVEQRHLATALRQGLVSFGAAQKVSGALAKVKVHLDRPDGLLDGQPAEPVLDAVLEHVVQLMCEEQFGLQHDPALDPQQAATLSALQVEITAIGSSNTTQAERLERALVLLASHLRLSALPAALEDIVLALLPSLLEERETAAADKRALALSPNDDGTWNLEATLTPEAGEQLFTALAAEARRDPANPLDTHARAADRSAVGLSEADMPAWEARSLRENGEGMSRDPEALVPRSRSKRLHDAFGRLLTRYLAHGLGGLSGKVPVQVTVATSSRAVEGAPGAPPARGASGRAVARSLLRRWWCDAHVTTLLMSSGWKPVGVVHSARAITGTELKAVRTQFANRCPGLDCCPGTPDPLVPLVPHHVRRHALYGETSIEETLLVCDRLHQDLHVGKRTICLRNNRLVTEDGYLADG
jgi:hypothetical protein